MKADLLPGRAWRSILPFMRSLSLCASLALTCALAGNAAAQNASAGGSLGVGMFGDRPTTTVDLGLDVDAGSYAFGLGARLRYLAGDGVRSEDWDTPSEVARLLRYLHYTRDEPVRATLAMGELGGVTLGHGVIVDRYTSGLDVDQGHVGAQLRAAAGEVRIDALIDDVVAPRILGARASLGLGPARVGASAVLDRVAPSMAGTAAVPIVGLDAELMGESYDGLFAGGVYTDLVATRTGAGAHLGARASVALGDSDARLGMRGEARLASAGYLPGWIDPLYERTRRERLDRARADEFGGVGGLLEMTLEVPEVGHLAAAYASRPGTSRLATVGVRAPYLRGVQAALWAVTEVGGDDPARGLAFEARVRLPSAMFVGLEVARLYQSDAMEPAGVRPIWIGTAAVGATIGD